MTECVLVVTSIDDTTADSVIEQVNRAGVMLARFDLADFPESVECTAAFGDTSAGFLQTATRHISLE